LPYKVAVNVAVVENFLAVKGPKVAVIFFGCGSEGAYGSGNTGSTATDMSHLEYRDIIWKFLLWGAILNRCCQQKLSAAKLKWYRNKLYGDG
jgi:hypothetical protein